MTITIPDDAVLANLTMQVGKHLQAGQRRLVTAESCTGGWIGKAMTDTPGSAGWYAGGAIVYCNELKNRMLGVQAMTLAQHGAVSEAVVREMAEGALTHLGGEIAVAVSGIAGPDGGSADKPVGTVWFAWSRRRDAGLETWADKRVFDGGREAVRRQTVLFALSQLLTK